ncbi:hypothetical protein Salat_1368300 [Sesamum alatum]|uniref:Uncharacterized protein n=1 Tax=Sesamum alatum TaxID=300844 RepID=A0AAE1YI43_9LAMI|nr:hypothetical protein Salat_1368300 [Sesamum alatum]
MLSRISSKLSNCRSKKERAPSASSSRKYIVRKLLGDEGLEQIEFDGNEARAILKKLGFDEPQHMENKTWRFPIEVVDDDTQKRYSLELRQDVKFGPFGFHEDWAGRVVADRDFDGNEEIGFYVHPKTGEIHFSVVNADAASDDDEYSLECATL